MDNNQNKNRHHAEKLSFPVSIPLKYLKRSTEEKLRKMERNFSFPNLSSHEESNNIDDKSCNAFKRKSQGDVLGKLNKMRSIHEKMDNPPLNSVSNTYTNKPDLIPTSIKILETQRTVKAPDKPVTKNLSNQPNQIPNNIMEKSIESIKHKLPVIALPERVKYIKQMNMLKRDDRGIYLKKRNESAYTMFKDTGSNTSSFDESAFKMLEIFQNSNITLERLKEVVKKKSTVDIACNTEKIIDISSVNNVGNLVISDINNSSDKNNDINNNGDKFNSQLNHEVDRDDAGGIIEDSNIFKTCLIQSNRNKSMLREIWKSFMEMEKDSPLNIVQRNNSKPTKIDNITVNDTDNGTHTRKLNYEGRTMANEQRIVSATNKLITENAKFVHTQSTTVIPNISLERHKPLSVNNLSSIDNRAINVGSSHWPTGNNKIVNKDIIVPCTTASVNSVASERVIGVQKSNTGDFDANYRNIIKDFNVKEIGNKGFAVKVPNTLKNITLDANNVANIPKQINDQFNNNNADLSRDSLNNSLNNKMVAIRNSRDENADKERLVKLLQSMLDKLSEDAVNKKYASKIDSVTQTNEEIVKHTMVGQVPHKPQKNNANEAIVQTTASSKETNLSIFSKSKNDSTGAPVSQKTNDRFGVPSFSSATNKIATNDPRLRSLINPVGQSSGCNPTTQSMAPVSLQAISKPPADPRSLQQTQQYQQYNSPERHYGLQSVAQTGTNEFYAYGVDRAIQDPRLARTPNTQPVNHSMSSYPSYGGGASNHYESQLRPPYHDVRMPKPWQSLPNCFNPSWPNHIDQIRLPVPHPMVDFRNTPAPNLHQRMNIDNVERFQHLEQQQADWTSQIRNYPNSNWSHAVQHNHYAV